MRIRQLTPQEEKNFVTFRSAFPVSSLLYPSKTALSKSIIDAHRGIRLVFKRHSLHDYFRQGKGAAHKVKAPTRLLCCRGLVLGTCSLYRPRTKKGDPRIWPNIKIGNSTFSSIARADQMFAISVSDGFIVLCQLSDVDISREHIDRLVSNRRGAGTKQKLRALESELPFTYSTRVEEPAEDHVVSEIIQKLKVSAGKYIPAEGRGAMSVGKTVEKVLGIKPNSHKAPDYKGVELKSYRAGQSSTKLTTLFSKTPDWKNSPMSAVSIVKKYGWPDSKGSRLQVYCSISAQKRSRNKKGFYIKVNEVDSTLEVWNELHSGCVAIWPLEWLRRSLGEKHKKTVWISVASDEDEYGRERFRLLSAKVTGSPSFDAFLEAIEAGDVSVDFTMKLKGQGTKDHGYLFRIQQDKLDTIFWSEPVMYKF